MVCVCALDPAALVLFSGQGKQQAGEAAGSGRWQVARKRL